MLGYEYQSGSEGEDTLQSSSGQDKIRQRPYRLFYLL